MDDTAQAILPQSSEAHIELLLILLMRITLQTHSRVTAAEDTYGQIHGLYESG